MTPSSDTYLPWFIFRELPCIGIPLKKKLIQTFKAPAAVFEADPDALANVAGMTDKGIEAIQSHGRFKDKAAAELDRIRERGLSILAFTDPLYPPLLKKIPDPPMVLVYDGQLVKDQPCFSIVGSRKATSYGRNTARHLAAQLAARGFSIVSGMAAGIDTAAHKGALDAGGRTLAVMGAGLNHIYPRQNKALYRQIAASGAALSEFTLDAPPLARHFPVRNRIIAGLSCGTLVVEAARKSGSLITARLAGEYNREVFAVPGSIRSAQSRGTHWLLRQGVRLVETETDIIEELFQFVHAESTVPSKQDPPRETKKTGPVMDKAHSMVYKHLDPYPRHIDEIIEASGLESSRVLAILTALELSGRARRHPGNLFSLSKE